MDADLGGAVSSDEWKMFQQGTPQWWVYLVVCIVVGLVLGWLRWVVL